MGQDEGLELEIKVTEIGFKRIKIENRYPSTKTLAMN